MPRFFKENFKSEPFITGQDASHIAKSLRMKVGEGLTVCDTFGTDFLCEISSVSPEKIELSVLSEKKTESEPSVNVTLFFCLTKSDKADSVIKQSVELGISKIVPVLSSRCISRPDSKQMDKKVSRWQKISDEAAMQSGRGILPKVEGLVSFDKMCDTFSDFDKVFFFYELGGKSLEKIDPSVKKIAIVVGSEGGFSTDEAELAIKNGALCTTLGKRILRAETAPIAALTAVMLLSDNLG